MQLERRNRILLALVLGTYFGLASLFLDPFTFLDADRWLSFVLVWTGSITVLLVFAFLLTKSSDPLRRRMLALMYLLFSALLGGVLPWFLHPTSLSNSLLYFSSFLISAIVPLALAVLWFIFDDLKNRITVSSQDEYESAEPVFKLTNEKGKVLLNVKLSSIICFEANDNYVITYYLHPENGISKTMERIPLKRIYEIVDALEVDFLRVHKSFLVNPEFVLRVEGKAQAYRLRLEHLDKEVPVSRSFDVSRFQA